ncbi:MAG: Glu-tRNA(Gln) amidotransferase subunit GatE, partial [Candidatus Woesearchaeota archaeon]
EKFYEELNLKVGLEIHQQLDTKKLFCNCDSKIIDDSKKPDFIVERFLRVQAGETGTIDRAALFEFKKEKKYIYNFYSESCCLVELDEEPPHEINNEALKIAFQFSKLVNARINDVIQVMRKTVIDGSNTSGFQRTALIATNGFVKIKNKIIRIPTICLEEDAAKIISNDENSSLYNLSRLGIPLLEISTEPCLNSPKEVKEAAEHLGILLRSLKVKRGIGTIRQDINISIKNGNRVEIKGAQDLRALPLIVELEVERQLNLIKIKEILNKRGLKKEEDVKVYQKDITYLFNNVDSKVIKKGIENNGIVLGIKVEKFSGIFGIELNENKRLGTELATHCKLFGLKGLIHSDELPNYGIKESDILNIKKELSCNEEDGFIIITGDKEKVLKAAENVIERLRQCVLGVPEEVRKVDDDYKTSFLRPIPSSARMYPETDIPLIVPFEVEIPKTLFEVIEDYENLGLSNDLARICALSKKREFFEKLINKYKNVKPKTIAQIMFLTIKDLKTRLKLDTSKINDHILEKVINALDKEIISLQGVEKVLESFINGKNIDQAIEENKSLSIEELENKIKEIIKNNRNVKNENAIIGIVMQQLRGKADGKKIVEIVKKIFSEEK